MNSLAAPVSEYLNAALAFVYPADTRMQQNRWNAGVAAWLAANALFLAANFAMLLK